MLGEANGSLLLVDAALSGHWDKSVVHGGCAKGGEDDDAKRDELQVLPARVVEAGLSVIVGQGKILNCRGAEAREADMCQDEEHEDVDGQAWDRSALVLPCLWLGSAAVPSWCLTRVAHRELERLSCFLLDLFLMCALELQVGMSRCWEKDWASAEAVEGATEAIGENGQRGAKVQTSSIDGA